MSQALETMQAIDPNQLLKLEDAREEGLVTPEMEDAATKSQAKSKFVFRSNIDELPLFVLRRCTPAEYDRYLTVLHGDDASRNPSAYRTLAVACVLYPEKKEFSEIINEFPGLPLTISSAVLQLSGLAKVSGLKKK